MLSDDEVREKRFLRLFCVGGLPRGVALVRRLRCIPFEYHSPSRLKDLLARRLELHPLDSTLDRGRTDLAVGVEDCYKVPSYEVVHLLLPLREPSGALTRRDDGMVVGDLLVIEYLLVLAYRRSAQQGSYEGGIGSD